ncbi:MAG: hypothetical protein HEQ38_07120 [Gemmatimonas sp.]|jgi:hypothetical protein|nr:hypothetical protein [Gemmatimonas sp.]
MLESHPEFRPPTDPTVKIWRYLTLAKFVSLLERRALFFCRSDKLGDPFEGSVPIANALIRKEFGKELGLPEAAAQSLNDGLSRFSAQFRKFVAVNCWHMGEYESAAMWAIYGQIGEAVAVQTTYAKLAAAISDAEETVYIGCVQYLDYTRHPIREGNMFTPFVCKRLSFQHEHELRAVIVRTPEVKEGEKYDPPEYWDRETIAEGISVPVRLDTLVERVYVSPTSPDWFADVVATVAERFEIGRDQVVRSSLQASPFF